MLDARPYKGHKHPVPQGLISEVQCQLDELLELGIIKEASTDPVNPLVIVKKFGIA